MVGKANGVLNVVSHKAAQSDHRRAVFVLKPMFVNVGAMKDFFRTHVTQLIILVMFVFAVYSNVRLAVRNYQINQRLKEAKTETALQELENKKLKLLIAYYQTPSYQEVEARRRLGLQKEGETVLAIKGLGENGELPGLTDSAYEDTQPEPAKPKTNIQLWWEYFFK